MENIKFLFLFFVIAVFLTACASTNTPTTSPNNTAPAANANNAANNAKDAKTVLLDTLKNKLTTFKVSYEMTGVGQASEMTMYFKGAKIRYDTEVDGQKGSIYFLDNKVYSCAGSPMMCLELGASESPAKSVAEQTEENIQANIDDYSITAMPSRTIAGQKASCFGVAAADVESEACYSSRGVPLYTKASSNGQTVEMTATSYSENVPDSDFELPEKPQNISQMMQQYPQQ